MQKFSEIIGQKAIKDHIYNALRTGSVSHAYILNGDAGSGRKTIAYTFAAALQCEDLQEETAAGAAESAGAAGDANAAAANAGAARAAGAAANAAAANTAGTAPAGEPERYLEPCGKCLSCIQAQSSNHPDIITVTHEKPASISVGEIRRMRSDVQIKPYSSARKIYIIPDAEKLTIQAQNALLKTLEEPPEYAVIILIADGLAGFLPTILSRCVVLQMRAVEEAQIAEFLRRRQNIDPDQAQILARFAGGNPGKALQLTEDQEFMELRDRAVDFLAHIGRADIMQISEFASNVDQARRDDLLGLVLMWYRDVLLYHSTRNSDHLIFQEDLQYIIEAADTLSYEQLGAIIDQTDLASRRLKSNVSADSVLEMMFLNIRSRCRSR